MLKVDLITGFLGAGKTTFIHRYLQYLRGRRVLLIENEFSPVGVDKYLLRNEDCVIRDLSGMCMCCRGKSQLIAMLAGAAAGGFDRVLIEPSGIYDVDEFFGVMNDDAVRGGCEIGCILTVVDAGLPEALSGESEYLMVTQLLAAGTVILSKTQLRDPDAPAKTVERLNALIAFFEGGRTLENVCAKDWEELTDADFEAFGSSGFHRAGHIRMTMDHEQVYAACITAGYCRDMRDLTERIARMMSDPGCGRVIRAKGYVRDFDGNVYEVNCTPGERSVTPAKDIKRGTLTVIGQDLSEKALAAFFLTKGDAPGKA